MAKGNVIMPSKLDRVFFVSLLASLTLILQARQQAKADAHPADDAPESPSRLRQAGFGSDVILSFGESPDSRVTHAPPVAPVLQASASLSSSLYIQPSYSSPTTTSPSLSDNMLIGVDVSGWQKEVDWNSLKNSGVHFAYLKATEGRTFVDPTFATKRQEARRGGIVSGAYHYFRPGTPVLAQVDNFMRVVGKIENDDLPPVLDLEQPSLWGGYSQEDKEKMIMTWLDEVEKRSGVRPIIYASPSFVKDVLRSSQRFAGYRLWLAHYTSGESPDLPEPFTDWFLWQYTESGRLPGVNGKVDINRFRGTITELQTVARLAPRGLPSQVLVAIEPSVTAETAQLQGNTRGGEASEAINFELGPS